MNSKIKMNLYAFLTVLIWGSGFPFTRMIGDQISSYSLGFIRCFLSAAVLLAIGKVIRIRKPFCGKDLLWFFLSGALGFSLYFTLFSMGLETISSATGSIITAMTPILVAIAAMKLYSERINWIGWISIFCAFGGVVILLLWNGVLSINMGAAWMLLSAIAFAGYNLLNRKFAKSGYTDLEVATYSAVFGAIQTLVFLPRTIQDVLHADAASNLSAVYLGAVAGAAAYYLWSKALALADRTSEVTNYLFVNPLIAAVIGFLMLREMPDLGTLVGGVIIIISVVLFSTKGNPDQL
ncbi:MAG: DMT family transporter [Firmicutes bacterium]|jgi:drug/metabolite transporter (DMT)-like permease|nr:DMT family transporter [Bacillota bacterium]NBI61816.1 DMT family transporter [Clostridiales bacterium]